MTQATRSTGPTATSHSAPAAGEAEGALYGSRLIIDTDAIAANWTHLRAKVGHSVTCAAAVKSDAYGCGLAQVVRALAGAGCTTFFVALPQEGSVVRREVPGATIYVLNGLLPGVAAAYAEARLQPVLSSLPEVEEWALFCRSRNVVLGAALHLDTGMNRLGLSAAEARRVAADSAMLSALDLTLIMSHLACGATSNSPFNAEQLARFRSLADLFPEVRRSLANSAGIHLGPDYHFDLVRPGIALYGGEIIEGSPDRLQPVVKLEARILQVRQVAAGVAVGYGQAQVTRRPTRLAIVSTGYGDGYHRRAGGADSRPDDQPPAYGVLAGSRVPLFGRVSMDLLAVDVTDVPADLARRGAFVQLYGPDIDMTHIAGAAQTIDYELLTSLGHRHRRVYAPLQAPASETVKRDR